MRSPCHPLRWVSRLCVPATALLAGCGTLSNARPLEPGRHELGVVLGGPLLEFAGAPIPLPNLVLGGRSGLTRLADRPLDLGYGLNATGLPFGIVALQADMSWLALDQKGAAPALTLRDGLYVSNNLLGPPNVEGARKGAWFVHELEVQASWKTREHVVWTGLSQSTDFAAPSLVLTPSVGLSLDPGEAGGFRFQTRVSWFAVNRAPDVATIAFVPGKPGAIGVHLGFVYGFGEAR